MWNNQKQQLFVHPLTADHNPNTRSDVTELFLLKSLFKFEYKHFNTYHGTSDLAFAPATPPWWRSIFNFCRLKLLYAV